MTMLALPDELAAKVTTLAEEYNTTIEAFLTEAISRESVRLATGDFFVKRRERYNPKAFQAALQAIDTNEPDENDRIE
jgi:predicted transcriptional regulator